jgi:hypothetical protein
LDGHLLPAASAASQPGEQRRAALGRSRPERFPEIIFLIASERGQST